MDNLMTNFKKQVTPWAKSTIQSTTFPIRYLPNSFNCCGIPKGIDSYKNHDYNELYPASLVKRLAPKTIYKIVHWKFLREMNKSLPEAFVSYINDGISTNISANLTSSYNLIAEVSKQHGLNDPNNHKIFSSLKFLPKIHSYSEPVITLTTWSQSWYFHWMFDVLPKIHLLNKIGWNSEKIYIEVKNSFQRESLTMLGIKSEQIINSAELNYVSASKLIIPSLPGSPGNMPKWACDFLRQSFVCEDLKLATSNNKKNCRRIYISRADARGRKIVNESELVEFLKSYEFDIIKPEYMSFKEQIDLFVNIEIIVSPHGAGLSNLVFCQNRVKVIEIFSPNYVNVCFWALTEQLGLDYYYVLGKGENPPDYYDPNEGVQNIEVDIKKLKETFQLAEIT